MCPLRWRAHQQNDLRPNCVCMCVCTPILSNKVEANKDHGFQKNDTNGKMKN